RRAAWCARGAFLIELDGSLWMPGRRGETEAGLYRLRAGTTQVERVPVDISPQCALAHEGYLWIGTAEGLVRLDPKTYRQRALSAREGYCGGNATALAVRGDTLWVASGLGVTRVTVAEFERRAKRVAPKGRAS
ncbi:MAG: hypothetical protein ACE5JM_05995, partial [Armatimonadota bacterium]